MMTTAVPPERRRSPSARAAHAGPRGSRCSCGNRGAGPSGECAACRRRQRGPGGARDNRPGRLRTNRPHGNEVAEQAAASPAPACANPGSSRTVDVQPVTFKSSASDPNPTGTSWSRRLRSANTIWGKLGVSFSALSTVEKVDATRKTASGATLADFNNIRSVHNGSGIEVFLVDNDMSSRGGGGTIHSGSASAQIVLSDRGTSDTLLAHELGHVLGLGHPPGGADTNTIMTPSGSNSSANPTRNTMGNYNRITWPSATGSTCLSPDS